MAGRASQTSITTRRPRASRLNWSLLLALAVGWGGAAPLCGAEIAIVRSSDAEPYAQAEGAIREKLAESKHAIRTMNTKEIADKGLAATLGNADVVVAVGTSAARLLQKQLPEKAHLIYCMVSNPEEVGLLQGRLCWGVTTDIAIKDELNLISQTVPQARTIGVLYRADAPGKAMLEELKNAIPATTHIEAIAVGDHPSVAAAIDALMQKKIDMVWTSADQKLYDTASVRTLLLAALRNKIPVWGFSPAFVRAGALIGVGVDPKAQGVQAAGIVLAVLADPKSFKDRAQHAAEYQVAVNLVVAKQLDIDIPEEIIRRATFVFRAEK